MLAPEQAELAPPPALLALGADASTPVRHGGTAPFDTRAWWTAVCRTHHPAEPRFTPFGSLMSADELAQLILSAPATVEWPVVTLDHQPSQDILIGSGKPIPTPKGWRFPAGALKDAISLWRSVEGDLVPKPSDILQAGWTGQWVTEVAPAYFRPIAGPATGPEWDAEVSTLARMGAIKPYTLDRLRSEGPPVVVNPTFLTEDNRPIDDMRYPNLGLEPPYFRPDSLSALLGALSPSCVVSMQDIKAGWMHIPYGQWHARHTAFVHKGVIWSFETLAFGDASAPWVFVHLTRVLKRYLVSRGIWFWI